MFDIGFWELTVVAVVALLVVGPERLPKLARTAGLWLGKGRRFLSSVKGEIDRELKTEELKRIMAEQAKVPEVYEFIEETKQQVAPDETSARTLSGSKGQSAPTSASPAAPSTSKLSAKPPAAAADAADPARVGSATTNHHTDSTDDPAPRT